MGDWSFRSLGDIIDRSNFQSVPPCDKLVNSLTNTRHPHFYIWSFPEADKGMSPITVLSPVPRIEIGLYTHVMRAQALKLRGFEQDERVHFKMHFSWIQIWQKAV